MSMPMWHPLSTRTPARRRGPHAFFVGAVSGAVLSASVVASLLGGASTNAVAEPVSPAPLALASAGDPPCGFDVYRGVLSVGSLGKAHGTIRVWLGDRLVRSARVKRGQWVDFPLKRRHSSADFTVSIVSRVTADDGGGRVWRCEPA